MLLEDKTTEFEQHRKDFYRLWYIADRISKSSKQATKEGRHEDARAAMTAFRVMSKEAKSAYKAMDSLREARPTIIDTDVAIEEDLTLVLSNSPF
jgi:hypothetical protein